MWCITGDWFEEENRMIAHWYDWTRIKSWPELSGEYIEGDSRAFSKNGLLSELRMELNWIGWTGVRAMSLNHFKMAEKVQSWQYAYQMPNTNTIDRCALLLDPDQAYRILIGPEDFYIYGLGGQNQSLPLSVSPLVDRNNPMFHHLPLL